MESESLCCVIAIVEVPEISEGKSKGLDTDSSGSESWTHCVLKTSQGLKPWSSAKLRDETFNPSTYIHWTLPCVNTALVLRVQW